MDYTMKMLIPSLALLFLVTGDAQAIKVTIFVDTDTFVKRAKEIIVAKCVGPVRNGDKYDDGLYEVDVEITAILKGAKEDAEGARKLGKATIATIYPMEAGKTYLLTSLGGSTGGASFLAVPELSVVELPPNFRFHDLKGKKTTEQVRAAFAARLQEIERRQRLLEEEKRLLDKAVQGK
jgi:hypothetical protein